MITYACSHIYDYPWGRSRGTAHRQPRRPALRLGRSRLRSQKRRRYRRSRHTAPRYHDDPDQRPKPGQESSVPSADGPEAASAQQASLSVVTAPKYHGNPDQRPKPSQESSVPPAVGPEAASAQQASLSVVTARLPLSASRDGAHRSPAPCSGAPGDTARTGSPQEGRGWT